MDITCRPLEAKESSQYRQLRLESLRLHPECFGSKYEEQAKLPQLFFERQIEQRCTQHVMLGAFMGDNLVGLCGLISSDANNIEIVQMYVSASVRGQGVGGRLLNLAKELAQKPLVLTVYKENCAAICTYETAGFKIISHSGKELTLALSEDA